MMLPNKAYDILKWIALICIPAVATFYSTVAPIFGWWDPAAVSQIATAVCTLIGALIGISTAQYNKEGK